MAGQARYTRSAKSKAGNHAGHRKNGDNSGLENMDPPPAGPVSLGAYTKFKPLPGKQPVAGSWRNQDARVFDSAPEVAQPRSFMGGFGGEIPARNMKQSDNMTPSSRDKGKGRMYTSSPLKKELVLKSEMSPQAATRALIGDQFDIEEWISSSALGPHDPTVLESVPVTPELIRSKVAAGEMGRDIEQIWRKTAPAPAKGVQPFAGLPVPLGTDMNVTQDEGVGSCSVTEHGETTQPDEEATSDLDLERKPGKHFRRGTLNREFRFPPTPTIQTVVPYREGTRGDAVSAHEMPSVQHSRTPQSLEELEEHERRVAQRMQEQEHQRHRDMLRKTQAVQERDQHLQSDMLRTTHGIQEQDQHPHSDMLQTNHGVQGQSIQEPDQHHHLDMLHTNHGVQGQSIQEPEQHHHLDMLRATQNMQQQPQQQQHHQHRGELLRSLHGISTSASARASALRTVMHDPMQAGNGPQGQPHLVAPTRSRLQATGNGANGGEERIVYRSLEGPSDPLPWKSRKAEIVTIYTPPMTDDELRAHTQAFIARARQDDAIARGGRAAREARESRARERSQQTEEWWHHDGRGQEQLRTYLEQSSRQEREPTLAPIARPTASSLTAATTGMPPASSSAPAPTGTAPTSSSAAPGAVGSEVLIPLLCNLNAYLTESPYTGRGMDRAFKTPPEWCVDTSRAGLSSFFGQDCGAIPQRFGRDPRYSRAEMPSQGPAGFGSATVTQPQGFAAGYDQGATMQPQIFPPGYEQGAATTQQSVFPPGHHHEVVTQPPVFPPGFNQTATFQTRPVPSGYHHPAANQARTFHPGYEHTAPTQPRAFQAGYEHTVPIQPRAFQSGYNNHTTPTQPRAFQSGYGHTTPTQPRGFQPGYEYSAATQPRPFPAGYEHAAVSRWAQEHGWQRE